MKKVMLGRGIVLLIWLLIGSCVYAEKKEEKYIIKGNTGVILLEMTTSERRKSIEEAVRILKGEKQTEQSEDLSQLIYNLSSILLADDPEFKEIVSYLIILLDKSCDIHVKESCAHTLRILGVKEAIPVLWKFLGDKNENFRTEVIQALVSLGADDENDKILNEIIDWSFSRGNGWLMQHIKNEKLKERMKKELKKLIEEENIPFKIKLATVEDKNIFVEIKMRSIEFLLMVDPKENLLQYKALYQKWLKSDNVEVRRLTVDLLVRTIFGAVEFNTLKKRYEVISSLIMELANDPDEIVREKVKKGLETLDWALKEKLKGEEEIEKKKK